MVPGSIVLDQFGFGFHHTSTTPTVEAASPAIAIVDIGLPEMDGYEVARRVRAALGTGITLVALTGYSQPEERDRATDAGFDVHLTKPVGPDALMEVLARVKPHEAA